MERELLAANLERVRLELAEATEGRWPVPRLVAVTKTHPLEDILPLRELGVTDVGENRVQELREKLPALAENYTVHLIGQLQSNKVKYIMESVSLIHSLDRWSLAREIDRQAQIHGKRMPVLVQVSPAGEPQKGGMDTAEVPGFIREAAKLPGMEIRGLMAVMPDTRDEDILLPLFRGMRTLFEQIRDEAVPGTAITELSMGMSGDYRLAARCGATMVRIGSAIFGPRPPMHP
ncbi:MAG: YggS family pyridoxal phosphate-dependent enzyme [Clostridia bacterium]|nr:YggS family pyridoxal phosphate-dependent enzyme [Clostridia bacterium]